MVRLGTTLAFFGFGSAVLHLMRWQFTILQWSGPMQPALGLSIGGLGAAIVLIKVLTSKDEPAEQPGAPGQFAQPPAPGFPPGPQQFGAPQPYGPQQFGPPSAPQPMAAPPFSPPVGMPQSYGPPSGQQPVPQQPQGFAPQNQPAFGDPPFGGPPYGPQGGQQFGPRG
jgi:hypothetical protein